MKTWEMIKELTENPEKKFRRIDDRLEASLDIDDSLIWKSGHHPFNIDDEWEEVKKPVSFMEAVASGKNIRVNHPRLDSIDYLNIRDLLNVITSNRTTTSIGTIMLDGKFYIED